MAEAAAPVRSRLSSARACIICCHESDFFCVGSCGHAVCFECGIRIRIVCRSKECPVCRFETPEVYIVSDSSFDLDATFRRNSFLKHAKGEKYGIKFESKAAVDAFCDILAHVCTVCPTEPEFPSFEALQQHMRRQHELFYCDLCLPLTLFSWERKCYNRRELAQHRRVGDPDDRSHRGHPLCTFCDNRFLDNDHLYRHLRLDHFYCRFCDADGINHFYDTYSELKDHFREMHFLCEEGQCGLEHFPPAFGSEIDFKGHKAANHSKEMQKAQRRQERTLNLEFHYDRPGEQRGFSGNQREFRGGQGGGLEGGRGGPRGSRGGRGRQRENRNSPRLFGNNADNKAEDQEDQIIQIDSGNAKIGTVLRVPAKRQPPQEVGDGVTVGRKGKEDSFSMESQDFPSLGQSGHGGFSSDGFQNFAGWNKSSAFGPGRSGSLGDGDFPVLGCGSSHQVQQPSRPSSSPKGTKKIAGVVLIDDYEAFPSVSKSAKSKQQSLVEQVVSEKENITPVDNAWTKQGQRKSPSLFETLTSGAWSSRPKTLGQAAMALSNDDAEFPSLGGQGKLKGHKEVKPVALARAQAASVWHKPASCDSNSLITDDKKIIDSAVNKKKIEGFGKDCKNSDDTTVGKQRGVERLVTLPSAKTKARKVAQQKQRPSLSESLSTNELEDPQKDPELCEMFSLKNHEEKLPPGLEPPPGLQPAEEVSPSGMHAVPEKSQIVEHLHEHFHGKYEKPRNFDERNRKLFQKIALNLSSLQMDDFKMLSGMFRRGEAGAQFYFEQVESLLGAKVFEDIFPELLCLLPDIKRQRALLEVRETTVGTARNSSAKSAKKRGPWQSGNLFDDTIGEFRICRYCAQVLRDWDHAEHVSGHELDQDYPTLC